MTKRSKSPQTYFSSDFHFNHFNGSRGIITFERFQFKTIEEHDQYLINTITNWSKHWAEGSTFWYLGDWGNTDFLWVMDLLLNAGVKCYFIYGNHDSLADKKKFENFFDAVYEYPVYISQKLVLSHFPVATYNDTINVHGHLHSSRIQDINHINANIHVANYQPISEKQLAATFSKLPKYTRRFLYEPWAANYQFTQNKEDVIMDRNGNIDLSASRLLQKINKDFRNNVGNVEYNPYTGGLDV